MSAAAEFRVADLQRQRDELVALNVEYLAWAAAELGRLTGETAQRILGMPASDYVPTIIDKVCGQRPPEGVFYLVWSGGELAGMGGLRRLDAATAEVKRLYIRAGFRGQGLGEQVLDRLVSDAAAFGYRSACLDTAPFMRSAQRLYEGRGFVDRPAYDGTEVPPAFHARWRFMERPL